MDELNKTKKSSITSFFPSLQSKPTQKPPLQKDETKPKPKPIQKKSSSTKKKQPQETHVHVQSGSTGQTLTSKPHSPPRITIDLTLDSPVKAVPTPQPTHKAKQKHQTTQAPIIKPGPHAVEKTVPKLETFSDFENARRQKIKKNTRPLVSPAWPSNDFLHQRYLDHQDQNLNSDNHHTLSRRKGKRPIRNSYFLELEQDQAWTTSLVDTHTVDQPDYPKLPSPPPTLKRLDLQPPINLIPHINDNPIIYQHPLLQKLLKLLSQPDHSPMTFDHPILRRQHHRASDSLNHLWTNKYAPKKASEMLGDHNVQSARTLKSWLLEIALKEAHRPTDDQMNFSDSTTHQKKSTKQSKQRKSQASQKPKRVIIRSVDPPKRKSRRFLNSDSDSDSLKDFIVSDGTDDEDTIFARDISVSEPEDRASRSPRRSLQFKNYLNPSLEPVPESSSSNLDRDGDQEPKIEFKSLTNLILLQGPNGVGKSCAVQAVAEEMGWEVFEVNPGVLRNRKELDRLIGDVSKNHVLSCSSPRKSSKSRKNHHSIDLNPPIVSDSDPKVTANTKGSSKSGDSKPVNPFAKMMKKVTGDQVHVSRSKRKIEALEDDEDKENLNDSNLTTKHRKPTRMTISEQQQQTAQKSTKQSLILLEEVDVVYGQDKDFWAGVIELVSQSMRPIVMTCNDSSVLPIESLPIQMVLEFKPPPLDLVCRFLQLICLIEGHLIDLSQLENFYLNNDHVYQLPTELKFMGNKGTDFHMFEIYQLPPEDESPDVEGCDVRRSMNQLQFFCQWAIGSRFLGIDWIDLKEDKASKMLFCSHSLPSSVTTQHHPLLQSRKTRISGSGHENLFDKFGDDHFELDWLDSFLRQQANDEASLESQSYLNVHDTPEFPACESQQLTLLAKAHDNLSFADAFVDKDFEIEAQQFESEIAYSITDNVTLDNSRLTNATIEMKKIKPTLNHTTNNKTSGIIEEGDYDFDFQYQYTHPKRPFTLLNYTLEKSFFRSILFLIFNSFLISSSPDQNSSDKHLTSNKIPQLHYLCKYFMVFNYSELVKIRTRNLKDMNEYMSFEGSRSFPMNIKDYVIDYNAFVRLIFEFDHSSKTAPGQEPSSTNNASSSSSIRALRKSVRLNSPSSNSLPPPPPTFILNLSPLETHLFLTLIKKLD